MKKKAIAVLTVSKSNFNHYAANNEKEDVDYYRVANIEQASGTRWYSIIELHDSKQMQDYHEIKRALKLRLANSRPDLSFITSQKFDDTFDYFQWYSGLSIDQTLIVIELAHKKLPELIQCAEMLFDANKDKPDSIVFQVVSETLNVK